MFRMRAVMLSGFLVAGPSLALAQVGPQQFDLQCSGSTLKADGTKEDMAMRLRIDLSRQVLCEDTCREQLPLTVGSAALMAKQNVGAIHLIYMIDRTTGGLKIGWYEPNDETIGVTTASCAKAPFSGMPQNQF